MKRFRHRLLRFIRTVLIFTLVFALLPWVSELAGKLLPEPLSARTVSEILSREMILSRRMETSIVNEEGILVSKIDALLLGTVQTVKIHYQYQASLGINLENIEILVQDGTVNVFLPEIEILTDRLIPSEVDVHDFWYPLTERRRLKLIADETEKRRAEYMTPGTQGYLSAKEKALESVNLLISQILEGLLTSPVQVMFADNSLSSLKDRIRYFQTMV